MDPLAQSLRFCAMSMFETIFHIELLLSKSSDTDDVRRLTSVVSDLRNALMAHSDDVWSLLQRTPPCGEGVRAYGDLIESHFQLFKDIPKKELHFISFCDFLCIVMWDLMHEMKHGYLDLFSPMNRGFLLGDNDD